ncbi:MAG: WD40 repeat domain-containing serine/threonine protein kinase, partial [Acidobacteriota bacterium]
MAPESAERKIFEACLGQDPEERLPFIARACAGNPDLELRVRRLLEAHSRAEERTLVVPLPGIPEPFGEIGPYRLLTVLGEGGMGLVYEAEQLYPVRRRVALKLIRWGMGSRQVVTRFEAERQALAMMDHANIARVLDAGSTGDGRPFFVMELVPGVPLTTFCDRERLSIRQRLELFITLAQAVQHAHQKGIIHRDLKPSNVMVARQDGEAVLKVIDFGIAKAVGTLPGHQTFVTQLGTALGTPAYMSPEQAETASPDIDTRTDIYSLGIILYELMAGALPVDPDEIGLHAFLTRLGNRDLDPVLPSARLLEMGARAHEVASRRRTKLPELARELKGDLDWIVCRAIDKDRGRRYESADALAADVRRYLQHEPLSARPPSRVYRARKFVRRHRPMVAAATIALVALLLGVVGVVLGLVQAEQSSQQALRQAVKANEAERDANSRLRNSLVAQARALRASQTPGRRSQSLRLLSQAAVLRPGTDLRDEAIASLALTDLEPVATWPKKDDRKVSIDFDSRFERHAWGSLGGEVRIERGGDSPSELVLAGFGLDPWVLSFSPDGRFLVAKFNSSDGTGQGCVRLWDSRNGNLIKEFPVLVAGASVA